MAYIMDSTCILPKQTLFFIRMMTIFLPSLTDMLTTQADRFSPEEVSRPPQTLLPSDLCKLNLRHFNSNILIFLFTLSQMEQMFAAFPPDVAGNLDYKNLVYVITHGEEKDQE